jgi:hypothetical protein
LIVVCASLGIGSRHFAQALPAFIAAYAGDTLWALVAFLAIGLILPEASTVRVAVLAIGLSFAVEASQCYHAPWLDRIRQTTVGGLILGFGFVWSDLACYVAGVGIGVGVELLLRRVAGQREQR